VIGRSRASFALLVVAAVWAAGVALVVTDPGSGAARPGYLTVSALPGVDLSELRALPGLRATSGPYPSVVAGVGHGGRVADVVLEGRAVRRAVVGEPQMISGSWARAGGLVLDQSTARALRVPAGALVTIPTATGPTVLRVSGISRTARRASYLTTGTLERIAPDRHTWSWTMCMELADTGDLSKYADWLRRRYSFRQAAVAIRSASG
jgi:hypothetical protein